MAKTVHHDVDVLPSPKARPQNDPSAPPVQKSKAELAKEYLDKFHPGWDVYLRPKDN